MNELILCLLIFHLIIKIIITETWHKVSSNNESEVIDDLINNNNNNLSNYIKVRPKASRAGFVCRTDQYFQRQRLTYKILSV